MATFSSKLILEEGAGGKLENATAFQGKVLAIVEVAR